MTPRAFGKRAARDEAGGGRIAKLRPALGVAAVVSMCSAAACKDSKWTPLGSAELVLSEIKLRGEATVARRLDSDESFGRSVTSGIATGDSAWLDVASRLTPGSATAEASLSIALAAALPRSPTRVLALLGEKYPVEEVCGIPFLHPDSALVESYHDDAVAALGRVRDTVLTKTLNECRAALDTARSDKLERINPAYIVKNKPAPAPRRAKKRVAKPSAPVTLPPADTSG